ncbi:MAG: EAL domain-containing protein [bacterium]|jgi:diguanylate cyclase (GGDEF)-like protein
MREERGTPPLVLVVDDDPGTRLLAAASLRQAGYATAEAADGEEGVSAYEKYRPDLVLIDVVMPRMDGFAAVREIRKLPGGDRVPVLMMTGLDDLSSIHRAYEAGSTDFAAKPINWVILGYRVGYLLRSARAFLDLADSEEKTRALLRAIPDRILRIGADGSILDLVAGDGRAADPPEGDLAGRNLSEIFPGGGSEEALRNIGEARKSGGVQRFEYDIDTAAGRRSFEVRIVSIPDGESLLIARDMTDRKKAEDQLAHMAYHDALTGLPNRVAFSERLFQDLSRAKRRSEVVGIVFLDLDRFKDVNDTLGHDAGDRLLVAVAERLRGAMRETDTLSRISGDEFCIILPDQRDEQAAIEAGRRVHGAFAEPFHLEGQMSHVTASMGISLYPANGGSPETLVKQADIAMFRAKALGGNTFLPFSEEMSAEVAARVRMEKGLRGACENKEFVLHYQPEIDLRTGRIVGAEALVRWRTGDEALVQPMQFIPLAEETGAIVPISEWVIDTACAQAQAWHEQGYAPFRISLNVSARLFHRYDLNTTIRDTLLRTGLDPGSFELEITESVAMRNMESTVDTLWKLNGVPIRVAMDDFGTGYSSLSYLQRMPIHLLKIDMSFIRNMDRNPENRTIVKTIIAMAHTLNIEVIAEGVERVEQLELLKAFGCDLAQGFYFSKAVPAAEFARLLEENRRMAAWGSATST